MFMRQVPLSLCEKWEALRNVLLVACEKAQQHDKGKERSEKEVDGIKA